MPPSSTRRALALAGLGALLLLWVAAVAALPAMASGPWPVVAVASLLAGLLTSTTSDWKPSASTRRRAYSIQTSG